MTKTEKSIFTAILTGTLLYILLYLAAFAVLIWAVVKVVSHFT